MAEPDAPAIDSATRASLRGLSDIVLPEPVSWLPQTWGWAVVAVALLSIIVWLLLRRHRRHLANRYRRQALAELSAIEIRLGGDVSGSIAAMAALLKRVALAVWPRETVAALSGSAWVAFLQQHSGPVGLPDGAAAALADMEYHQSATAEEATAFAGALRRWIEAHRV
jgi:hypothetical protein